MLCYVYGQNVIFIATLRYTPIFLKFVLSFKNVTYCDIFKPVELNISNFLFYGPVLCTYIVCTSYLYLCIYAHGGCRCHELEQFR